ncbi:ABC transporter ATP-binding protein [Entomomonas asaccharolytica]|uniref:ABC transporter ATP-binding protein n=1 Tax=Entomomonas asaccharolytica TaxID=2785331 RepID=A0A974RWA3_9GAMM|nr:ABC transporter ATP-binding protein [Entomomonas asaccharolytica]QQP84922.1 ABC transporter ATP-binding protein [Entomomonas asaccharolytica]
MSDLLIKSLSVAYGRRQVIENLSVEHINAGEVTALLGPNGSGKSTLLKAMAGLNAARGEVLFNGQDLVTAHFAERAKQVVYLPQSLPASVHLRAFESMLVARKASNSESTQQVIEEAMALLEKLGIEDLGMRYLDQLSGGQKQLVGLAQALIRQPKVLLLDEPLSALDLNHQFHVMDVIKQETRERDMVTVIVLHDINIALQHTDYVLMLKDGRLVTSGIPHQVISPEVLAEVYGVVGRVEHCSRGKPHVMIDGLVEHH